MQARAARLLAELPAFAALLGILGLLGITVRERLGFPYDLEWMEGGMLVHVLRLRLGLPLYAEPSLDFIPYVYPPGYPWLLSWLGEPSYALGRAVSLASALAAAGAAAWLVRREGAGWGFGAAGAALFLACYDDSGSFYDVVRGDALATAFFALSATLVRSGRRTGVWVAGLLLAAAFATKHNFALFGLPLALWLWRFRGRGAALRFVAASAGPALVFLIGMQLATDAAFLVYLLRVPASHPLRPGRGWPNGVLEQWQAFALAASVALGVALVLLRERSRAFAVGGAAALLLAAACGLLGWPAGALFIESIPGRPWLAALGLAAALLPLLGVAWRRVRAEGAWFHLGLLLTVVPLAALMRAHTGGFVNVLMPSHWVFAASLAALLGYTARERPGLGALFAGVLAAQVWSSRWEPERLVPAPEDRAGGDALIETLRGIEGEVFVPHGPWYPYLAGKPPGFALIALWDVDHRGGPYADLARRLVRHSFAARRWAAVITPLGHELKYDLAKHYRPVRRVAGSLGTVVGWRLRFGEVWEPVPEAGGAGDASRDTGPAAR